ncbi:hypothetical protein ACIRG4_05400 [Streptomyces sp. NPDC102395]|uniref:hypothetical protein n=1 Tax=Streptomyces sp. NPDC102395 TaxID=3366168 RepID=UPI0037FDC226
MGSTGSIRSTRRRSDPRAPPSGGTVSVPPPGTARATASSIPPHRTPLNRPGPRGAAGARFSRPGLTREKASRTSSLPAGEVRTPGPSATPVQDVSATEVIGLLKRATRLLDHAVEPLCAGAPLTAPEVDMLVPCGTPPIR